MPDGEEGEGDKEDTLGVTLHGSSPLCSLAPKGETGIFPEAPGLAEKNAVESLLASVLAGVSTLCLERPLLAILGRAPLLCHTERYRGGLG